MISVCNSLKLHIFIHLDIYCIASSIKTSSHYQNNTIMMYECSDSISEIVIPLTILNFFGTAVIILVSKCYDNWSNIPPKVRKSRKRLGTISSNESDNNEPKETSSTITLNERWSRDKGQTTPYILDTIPSNIDCSVNENIIQLTEDANKEENDICDIEDADIIQQVRASSGTHTLSTKNELAGEQASIENMAGTLISVTKNIAGALDNANHIPKEKKDELATLLKGVPGFITKIVDMDDEQLNALLGGKQSSSSPPVNRIGGNNSNVQGDLSSNNIITKRQTTLDQSDYLMKTLDSLRQ